MRTTVTQTAPPGVTPALARTAPYTLRLAARLITSHGFEPITTRVAHDEPLDIAAAITVACGIGEAGWPAQRETGPDAEKWLSAELAALALVLEIGHDLEQKVGPIVLAHYIGEWERNRTKQEVLDLLELSAAVVDSDQAENIIVVADEDVQVPQEDRFDRAVASLVKFVLDAMPEHQSYALLGLRYVLQDDYQARNPHLSLAELMAWGAAEAARLVDEAREQAGGA